MHDFFLHEAQAQLQMALFGMDEDFMESTNRELRDAFAGSHDDPDYCTRIGLQMMQKVRTCLNLPGTGQMTPQTSHLNR